MKHNFTALISARFSSDLAAFMALTIFTSYIYIITNNAYYVGAFFACRVFGALLGSILAPRIFHHGRIQLLLTSIEIGRALLVMGLLVMPISMQKLYLPLLAVLLGMGNAFFNVGLNLKIGSLFEDKEFISINSWVSSLSSLGLVLGILTAGLLLSCLKYPDLFLIDALIYLASAAFVFLIRDPTLDAQIPKKSFSGQREWGKLVQVLKENRILFLLLMATLIDTLASGSHNVGQPILAKLINPAHPGKTLGLMITVWAFGKLTGAWLIRILHRVRQLELKHIEHLFFMGVMMMSGSFILMFWQTQLTLILLFALFAGMGDGISEVNLLTRIQKAAQDVKATLFSCMNFLQMSGLMIGIMACTPFFAAYPAAKVVTGFHGIALLSALFLYFTYRKVKPPQYF